MLHVLNMPRDASLACWALFVIQLLCIDGIEPPGRKVIALTMSNIHQYFFNDNYYVNYRTVTTKRFCPGIRFFWKQMEKRSSLKERSRLIRFSSTKLLITRRESPFTAQTSNLSAYPESSQRRRLHDQAWISHGRTHLLWYISRHLLHVL